jgi:putative hydrolase of the HAD superfamily
VEAPREGIDTVRNPTGRNNGPCNLLIDADDTLWENNILFERVITQVQALLRTFNVDAQIFRQQLDEAELEHIPVYGYGTVNFARSLVRTFERVAPEADPSLIFTVRELALGIMRQPPLVIEGVPETLAYLARRHELFLVTKGSSEEQMAKIEASRLGGCFREVEILSEKNVSSFLLLLSKHRWDASRTWMIGNSPRSDINPALAAGMNAVYIPHPHTWILEHEDPVRHPNLLEVKRFSDLSLHF